MNIHCFGCSFTHDLYGYSWPYYLSKKLKNHKVINYAYPGSDVLYSIYCMEKIQKNDNDFFIFQGTGWARLCTWQEFKPTPLVTQVKNNYFIIKDSTIQENYKMKTMNFGMEETRFYKDYYGYMTDCTLKVQWYAYLNCAKQYADFSFTQIKKIKNFDSFQDSIGKEKYNSYVRDNGFHLNAEGCVLQADWVKEKIKDDLHVE